MLSRTWLTSMAAESISGQEGRKWSKCRGKAALCRVLMRKNGVGFTRISDTPVIMNLFILSKTVIGVVK